MCKNYHIKAGDLAREPSRQGQSIVRVKRAYKRRLYLGVSLFAFVPANISYAIASDSAEAYVLDEIIVSAQKRQQSVQDVPVAMSAFDADFVKHTNLDDVKDLVRFSPSFAGNSKDSFIDFINIRGISTNDFGVGGDPSAGFFKNGLYQGRNGVVVSSMFDMERAEVLRGPQGFLFGRNAISGAISLYTAKPNFDTDSGRIEIGVGERGIFEGEAVYNMAVSDGFALRFAAYHSEEDGYVTNIARPEDDKLVAHNKDAFRITAGFQADKWDATLMLEYEDRKQSGTVYRAIEGTEQLNFVLETIDGAKLRGGLRDIDSNASLGNRDNGEILSLSAEFNWDFGFAKLTSLTGYKDHNFQYAEDYDGLPYGANDYAQDQAGDYFEQELRLVSQSEGPLSWYAGVSYYEENISADFDQRADEEVMCNAYYYSSCSELFEYFEYPEFSPTSTGLVESNQVRGDYKGWGAYIDLTYQASDTLEFGMGLRYSKDEKDFAISILDVDSDLGPFFIFGVTTDGFDRAKRSWDAFTPRFVVRYMPTDDWSLYASVTKGYKSGGFGSFAIEDPTESVDDALLVTEGVPNAFNPETVWSYEIGAKGSLLDNRLKLDMTLYSYNYKDLQLSFFENGDRVANVGRVSAWGAETSVRAVLSEAFDIYLAGSFNQNKVSGADAIAQGSDGNILPGTPQWIVAGALTYRRMLSTISELNASLDFRAQTSTFGGLDNITEAKNPGWSDVALRIGYENTDAGWSVTAYVENLFDKIYFDGTLEGEGPIPHGYFGVSRPRTIGARLRYNFGG